MDRRAGGEIVHVTRVMCCYCGGGLQLANLLEIHGEEQAMDLDKGCETEKESGVEEEGRAKGQRAVEARDDEAALTCYGAACVSRF